MSIQVKLSAKSQAVTLKNLSKERAHEITKLLIGVEGITRITTEWDPESVNEEVQYIQSTEESPQDNNSVKIEYPEQPCEIVAHLKSPTAQEDNPIISSPDHILSFAEINRISRKALGPYVGIGIHNMGYHDQRPGRDVIICYGTTKVFTTWDDLAKLPCPVPADAISKLNLMKQTAVKQFRKWMQDQAKITTKAEDLEEDPDAPYRQQLPPGMIDTGTASIDSSKHEGPMPE